MYTKISVCRGKQIAEEIVVYQLVAHFTLLPVSLKQDHSQ